ncbi:MAG: excinuclease ABC subunit UvrB [Planctomycetota bacterium]|jgi:excinuclease ABC subunit B
MGLFKLHSEYEPAGDQPRAIEALSRGLAEGRRCQTLLGVTGSGKTFVMANVIRDFEWPVLVLSHNKTLAAQLYGELRAFFPDNAVHYFVSYYDYFQPEAYLPQTDTYIEKDASINDDIDRLRLAATSSLMTRRDVIIVASVSCIYGLGSPEQYEEMMVRVVRGSQLDRNVTLRKLAKIQYTRNDVDFSRGKIRVRGDVLDIFPAYEETAIRVELFGDEVEAIAEIDPLTGEVIRSLDNVAIYPAKHFVLPDGTIDRALDGIEKELEERLEELRGKGKLLEAQRLESRTRYDMEMLREIGYCPGVENYSRHLSGRKSGERPFTLLDYFPKEFLFVIDESHATIPQVRGMFNGDHSRKLTLVEHGFRLPSALDNRPMKFHEFEERIDRVVFVSATPADYELERSGEPVELVIRPTGLVDPPIEVRGARGQVADVMKEVRARAEMKQRVLVTTLTKRLSEDLAQYFADGGLKCRYLHSELDAIERVEILKSLRQGDFDVLVGVNLLREGLDLPEVSLVAVLDADKEGFLRSQTSLIQTIGRTARNVDGRVILYAEKETEAMRRTIEETARRRTKQLDYNARHGITPRTIRSAIKSGIEEIIRAEREAEVALGAPRSRLELAEQVRVLEAEMYRLADELNFEEAARVRDHILELQGRGPAAGGAGRRTRRARRPKRS